MHGDEIVYADRAGTQVTEEHGATPHPEGIERLNKLEPHLSSDVCILPIENLSSHSVLNTDTPWNGVAQIKGQAPLRVPGVVRLSRSQLKRSRSITQGHIRLVRLLEKAYYKMGMAEALSL